MKRLLLIPLALLLGAGCRAGAPAEPRSLVDQCVERTVAMYEKHDLPFTVSPAARPAICEDWIKDNGVVTSADFEIQMRIAERLMEELAR